MKKLLSIIAMLLVLSCVFANGAQKTTVDAAANWPSQPVQIIVGANAGGGIDTAARLIAKSMTE